MFTDEENGAAPAEEEVGGDEGVDTPGQPEADGGQPSDGQPDGEE